MDLRSVADEVYAAAPAEFVATRTALARRAREAGDKALAAAIGKLAKPSVAASLLNGVVREDASLAADLVDLGEEMRTAQAHLAAAELAALRPRRDELIGRILDAAAELASRGGKAASAATRDEVRGSLVAALADADAARAVTSGRLTRALSYAGFGEVDLAEAVALPGSSGAASEATDTVEAITRADSAPLRRRGLHTVAGAATAPARGGGEADDARVAAERDAARQRRIDAAQEALTEADHAFSEANLACAQADREAEKQRHRVEELAALLERARVDAQAADLHAATARAAAARAEAAVAAARSRLDAER